MTVALEEVIALDKHIPMRDLIARLQQTLERNHQKILAAALNDWQSRYAGRDPSDACASVHIVPAAVRARKRVPSFQKLVRSRRPKRGGRSSGSGR